MKKIAKVLLVIIKSIGEFLEDYGKIIPAAFFILGAVILFVSLQTTSDQMTREYNTKIQSIINTTDENTVIKEWGNLYKIVNEDNLSKGRGGDFGIAAGQMKIIGENPTKTEIETAIKILSSENISFAIQWWMYLLASLIFLIGAVFLTLFLHDIEFF
jgi:hypothetical protein